MREAGLVFWFARGLLSAGPQSRQPTSSSICMREVAEQRRQAPEGGKDWEWSAPGPLPPSTSTDPPPAVPLASFGGCHVCLCPSRALLPALPTRVYAPGAVPLGTVSEYNLPAGDDYGIPAWKRVLQTLFCT